MLVQDVRGARPDFSGDAPLTARSVDITSQRWVPSDALTRSARPPASPKLQPAFQSFHDDSDWLGKIATTTVAGATQWASTELETRSQRSGSRASLLISLHESFVDDTPWITPAAIAFSSGTAAWVGATGLASLLMPGRTRLLDGRHRSFVDDAPWIFAAAQAATIAAGAWTAADFLSRSLQPWGSTTIILPSGSGAGAGGIETIGGVLDPSLFVPSLDFTKSFMMPARPILDTRWQTFRPGFAIAIAPPIQIASAADLFTSVLPPRRPGLVAAHLSFLDAAPILFAAANFQNTVSQWMSAIEFQRASFLMGRRPGLYRGLLETFTEDWIRATFPIAFDPAWTPAFLFQMASMMSARRLLTRPIVVPDDLGWLFKNLAPPPVLPPGHKHRWPMILRRWHQLGIRRA